MKMTSLSSYTATGQSVRETEYLIKTEELLTIIILSFWTVRERPLSGSEAPDRPATQGTLGRLCQGNTTTNILGLAAANHLAQNIFIYQHISKYQSLDNYKYLQKSLPELCSNKTVDQEIHHGIENQENMRHKTENYDPDWKPSEFCFFTTGNKKEFHHIM